MANVVEIVTERTYMKFGNWKTTLSGIAALLAVAAKIANGEADWATDIPMVIAAVGLLMAKDHDVTGGTRVQ